MDLHSNRKLGVFLVVLFSASAVALAASAPPLVNWSAPRSYTPTGTPKIHTLADISSPTPFIAISPCRQYRSTGTPLPQGVNRAVTLTGAPCGIPAGAVAVSVNITVFNITGATGNGVFKVDTVSPPAVAWINYPSSETQRANAGVVALNGSGQIIVQVAQGAGQVDFVVDTNGYYASTPATATDYFSVINAGLYAIYGETSNPDPFAAGVYGRATAGPAQGVFGETLSTTDGTAGVFGRATSSVGNSAGVAGQTNAATDGATGVFGVATATTGQTVGVLGKTNSVINGSTGVSGVANATTGHTFGVGGRNKSTTDDASAVTGEAVGTSGQTHGVDGETYSSTDFTAGVLGNAVSTTGEVFGVIGASHSLASGVGVAGALVDTGGNLVAYGVLGSAIGTADTTGPPWGVFAFGDLGAMGAKHFVEPHASDPTKVILYSSLEGREVGTYFRGTSHIVNHQAVIEVPEDFRMVTDEEGLTVQLTPVGELATLAVVSQDLNQVVVKASRDVTFHYLVQGVRRAFKDLEPVRIGYEFVPRSPADTMQPFLTQEARRRLIANGTYNADGTVNMDTAERLGWAKAWRENAANTRAAPLARRMTDPERADEK